MACQGPSLSIDVCTLDGIVLSVPSSVALRMGYIAGLIEDDRDGEIITLRIPLPFASDHVNLVLSLAAGKQVGSALVDYTFFSEALEALVGAMNVASFLQAVEEQEKLIKHCSDWLQGLESSSEVCRVCSIAEGPVALEEADLLARLAAECSTFGAALRDPQYLAGSAVPLASTEILASDEWGRSMGPGGPGVGITVPLSSSDARKGDALNIFRASGRLALHEAVLLGAVESLNQASPLRSLSEDLLVLLAGRVAVRVVPDDGHLSDVLACTPDFEEAGVRIILRPGRYRLQNGLQFASGTAVIEALGVAELWSDGEAPLVEVGLPAVGSSGVERNVADGAMGWQEAGHGGEIGCAPPVARLLLVGVSLVHTSPSCHASPASPKGYWEGGAVVVRVCQGGHATLVQCKVSSSRGTGLVCEGATPGTLPYVVLSEFDYDDREGRQSMLLPYRRNQLIVPRQKSRLSHLTCVDCYLGPFPVEFGCAAVASMCARLTALRCVVRATALDGIIAAVGGEALVDACDIEQCGESAVVASGVSTYETTDTDGGVVVERSLMRVTRTRVARCREEALWACESVCAPGLTCWEEARASEFTGLLIHGECSIVECGGDTQGVTGGEVEALRL